ncbi:MAG: FAD-binding oxidoreductase, partial [Deltaproteobacteria bacterium]|nr:FAD-binding oxidoreductase [Deltaproteobacteria bacterium]
MPGKEFAKVDYQKPLEDIPYSKVVAEKESYDREVKNKLSDIVGKDNIRDDPDVLDAYSKDMSLEAPGRPAFVVFPENTEQVCDLVSYANEILLPLIPVSSGTHNYGATLPRMGGVIVDLSRWKKIHKIDHRNRAARIQPGVTYDELQDALEKEGLRAMIPLLPRRDQSVLTAHFEAHPMLIPEFNYSEPVFTAEIVMPTGTLFGTGAASVAPPEQVRNDLVGAWGPGFDWNRLYTRSQGTLGIITWA